MLFGYEFEPSLVDEIFRATNRNYVLGHAAFAEQVSARLVQRSILAACRT
jgi:hypothetical protein